MRKSNRYLVSVSKLPSGGALVAVLSHEEGLRVLQKRTGFVQVLTQVFIGISALALIVQAGDFAGAINTDSDKLSGLNLVGGLILIIYALTLFASIIGIGMWIYRAHANLRDSGHHLTISPGWAVGWYFVPIASLFKPLEAMRELWSLSHSESDRYTEDASPNIGTWWGFWVVGGILSNISYQMQSKIGAEAGSGAKVIDAVGTAVWIAAAWFLLDITKRSNAAQQATLGIAETFG